MAYQHFPGPIGINPFFSGMDAGTLCRTSSPIPGSLGLSKKSATYSYSISGTVGALGNMLFTEGTQRLPGTWYDRTVKTTKMRAKEAKIGLSGFGNMKFRTLAQKTLASINAPASADVDIHSETKDRIENITVNGQRGKRSFFFDFDKAEETSVAKDSDVMKPFFNTIDKILSAIVQVR